MEYQKGENGFTLEFNEIEEANLENFISTLKEHEAFSHLTSNKEFIAIILNEGVASLQQQTNTPTEHLESESLGALQELLASLIPSGLAALQHESIHLMEEKGQSISFDELLNLLPDFNSLFQETDQSADMDQGPITLDKSPAILPNKNTDGLS